MAASVRERFQRIPTEAACSPTKGGPAKPVIFARGPSFRASVGVGGGVMDAVFAHIWNFKDGKIVKYTQNVDTKKVWDAMENRRDRA